MSTIFIGYKKCSTCKNAKKWLDDNKIEYTSREIKEENPTAKELKEWYEKSGLPLKRFFNTSGILYREKNLKEKLPDMPEVQQLELLASDGMLAKRPLLITDNEIFIGFKESQWIALVEEKDNESATI